MAGQPLLHAGLAVIPRIVQVEDELLGVGVLRPQRLEQLDELLAGDVLLGQAEVHIIVIIRAVGPEDVQSLATVAHADVEPLAHEQPAGIEQVHAPDRVAGVDEVPPGLRPRLTLVSPVLPHELLLLLDVGLPEEPRDLVVAGPDPAEQVLDARDRVGHAQGLLHPGADLLSVVERPRGYLPLEPLDLGRSEATRVALVVQGAELLQPLVAEDAEPLADLAGGDPRQLSGLLPSPPVIDPEQDREALIDPAVLRGPSSFFDADSHGRKLTPIWTNVRGNNLPVFKSYREVVQPRDRKALPIQFGLTKDRVMATAIEMDHDPFGLKFHLAGELVKKSKHAVSVSRTGERDACAGIDHEPGPRG